MRTRLITSLTVLAFSAACSKSDVDGLADPTGSDAGANDTGMTIGDTGGGGMDGATGPADASVVAGSVELNTDSIDFGAVVVTSTDTRILTVRNPGNERVQVTLSQPTGRDAARFSRRIDAPETDGVFELAPGQTVEVTVSVSPNTLGQLVATMALDSCFGTCPVALTLTAEGVSTGVFCPDDLDIGTINPDTCIGGVVVCENRGNLTERITAVELEPTSDGEFTFAEPALPIDFTAGSTLGFAVTYCPTAVGMNEADLLVLTFEPAEVEHNIHITGFGGGPDIRCAPTTVDFGTIGIGVTLTQGIRCDNRGAEDGVVSATLGGTDFTVAPAALTLAPGGSGELIVSVEGTAAGTLSDTLAIVTNDPDSPMLDVPVSATVIDVRPCAASISPASRNFGLVAPGSSQTAMFVISNDGQNECLIRAIGLAGSSHASFSLDMAPAIGTSIAAGATVSFGVLYSPTGGGNHMGEVVVGFSNPATTDLTAAVSGQAGNSPITASPTPIAFGATPLNCGAPLTRQLTLTAVAGAAVITNIGLTPGMSPFGLTGIPNLPLRLGRLDTLTLTVEYNPQAAGVHTAQINVTLDGLAAPVIIGVTGEGSVAAMRTDTFDFASPRADLLLVVDDSCSMGDAQTALGTSIVQLADTLASRSVDFQVGVVTTDMQSMQRAGRLIGNPRILTPTTPDFETELADRVQPGIQGSGTEMGILATVRAVTSPRIDNENMGFLREDADLVVIIVSDEDDFSPANPNIADLTSELRAAAGRGTLSVSGVIGPPTGPDCEGPYGDATDSPRYAEFLTRVGNGLSLSFCNNMSANFAELAEHLFGGSRFTLGAEPIATSIAVTVDNVAVPATTAAGVIIWAFDAASNSVTFTDGNVPANGTTIRISYTPFCVSATCGDGVPDPNEQCDDGNMIDTDMCVAGCRNATCGDGFTQMGVEACDDGNMNNSDTCVVGCFEASCGDGFLQIGVEDCDDGNMTNGDGCPSNCRLQDTLTGWYTATGLISRQYETLPNARTLLTPTDSDDGFARLTLPFAFEFFGVPTSTLTISVNGFVAPGAVALPDSHINRSFPDTTPANGVIAVWWDDLLIDPGVDGGADMSYMIFGQAPTRTAVIQWRGVRFAPQPHSTFRHRRFGFQLAIAEDSSALQYRYGITETGPGGVPTVLSTSVGLENQDATVGQDLLDCTPACDGRPRPPRADGFPENASITITPVP